MTNNSRVMVRRIYVDNHAIGEPTYFNSFRDFNLYLKRSLGYANSAMSRNNTPIVSSSLKGTAVRKFYIIEKVGDNPVHGFQEYLAAFFGQQIGYFGKISTLTRKEVLSGKAYIDQISEKKRCREQVKFLLAKLNRKYDTLTQASDKDEDFQKLKSILRGAND